MKKFPYKLILASKSPRRQHLLKDLGFDFEIKVKEVDEVYPETLNKEKVPEYLSELKAKAFDEELDDDHLVITADTIVLLENRIVGKPKDEADAVKILEFLSGKKHEVITGVTLHNKKKMKSFSVKTSVYFKKLKEEEISFYIKEYKPLDKAGAYGIQEWIGYIGIEKIEGSYFNVMGLPVKELYEELQLF